jgi:exodeoxyribonuclease-3
VNSIRTRLEVVQSWLRTHQPDVMGLQETKVEDALFPAAELEACGYHVVFRGGKSYNGVALLSRKPPQRVQFGLGDGVAEDETRMLCAEFPGLVVVNTYIPQGRDITTTHYETKLAWFARLRAWFDAQYTPRRRMIWMGDMNVAHDPIDVFNPEARAEHVCYHEAVRRAFAECRAWGFEDPFRRIHPEGGHYTFFTYRRPSQLAKRVGWRLDYILATRSLAARATDAYIDMVPRLLERPSDHTVLVTEF